MVKSFILILSWGASERVQRKVSLPLFLNCHQPFCDILFDSCHQNNLSFGCYPNKMVNYAQITLHCVA